jgi:hypothetical protein
VITFGSGSIASLRMRETMASSEPSIKPLLARTTS